MVVTLILALVLLSKRWPHAHAWYPLLLPIIAFPKRAVPTFVRIGATHICLRWRRRYSLSRPRCGSAIPVDTRQRGPEAGYLWSFLILPTVAGVLYMRKNKAPFFGVMAATVLGYLTCYVIFFVFSTESPAHALRHLHTQPLPDGPLSSIVESLQRAGTHGNAFPSAHAVGAVVPVVFAQRDAPKLAPWLLPLLALMCVGAV